MIMKNICLFLLSILYAATAFAQNTFKVIIIDANNGNPVVGLKLYLSYGSTARTDSTTTNFRGEAFFSYHKNEDKLIIFSDESDSYTELSEVISGNKNLPAYTLYIIPKKVSSLEDVIVTAYTPIALNRKNATAVQRISRTELKNFPIEGRDITRAFVRIPNMTIATLGYAEAPNVAINGTNGSYTNYLIDGMDNNERFLGNVKFNTPYGFTEGVNIYTNNFSAEYGNTQTGIVNVLTRSGKNVTEGEVFYLTRPGKLTDASSAFATRDLSGNLVKDGFMRQQLGFGLGGAIRKDKTFYYINVEQTIDVKDNLLNVPQLNIKETVQGKNYFTFISGKIDQVWNTRFRSSLRANIGRFNIDRQGGGLDGGNTFPSAGSTQANRSYLIALKNSYDFSASFGGETNIQHSRFRWNYRKPYNAASSSVTLRDPAGVVIGILGQTGAIFDDIENTDQLQQKFTYKKGAHTLKFGVDIISSDFNLLGGGNPNGNYDVQLTAQQLSDLAAKKLGSNIQLTDIPSNVQVLNYQTELQTKQFGKRQNQYSLYVEDLYSVSKKLNLSLGLRYDYDNLTIGGSNGKGDVNNFGPRLSFNYAIDDRNVIRGGWGVFYDKYKYSTISDALQFSSTAPDFKAQLQVLIDKGLLPKSTDLNKVTFDGNILASVPGAPYLNGPSSSSLQGKRGSTFSTNLRILNPEGYENPNSNQFSLGYQRKLSNNTIFTVDLLYAKTKNLYQLWDLNSPAPYPLKEASPIVIRTVAQANATRPVPITGTTTTINGQVLTGIARDILVTKNTGRADYYSAAFVLQKIRDKEKYSYRLSYVLSSTKNNTDGINDRALDGNDFEAEYGYGLNDRRHLVSALFSYYPIKNLSVTPALLIQSGVPVTRYVDGNRYIAGMREFGGVTDLNGNGITFGGPSDRYPGEKRNGDRLPWATTLDFNAIYQLTLKNTKPIEITLDVFNLLNADNWSGYNATFATGNQQQLGPASSGLYQRKSASPPRQVQLGVRYVF